MSTIGKLFGSSPFGQIQQHMRQVSACVGKMTDAVEAMKRGEFESLEQYAAEVSRLEHECDQIKDDIRNRLVRRFFMPIPKADVLDIVSMQDGLADTAEDLCIVLTMKRLPILDDFRDDFDRFIEQNLAAFRVVADMVYQLDELIESGFGGPEGENIRKMAHDVAYAEHQADQIQAVLLRKLYAHDDQFSIGEFHLWMRVTRILSRISNLSENLANRILKTLSIR